jgi:signal recognition particle subunit SRP19
MSEDKSKMAPVYDNQKVARWVILYPAYIDAKKTLAEGRRISKLKAVENPTIQEIQQALTQLKIDFFIESTKAYPRDWSQRGRIRVRLFDEDHKSLHETIKTRKELFIQVAELISSLSIRSKSNTNASGGRKKGAKHK